MELEKTSATNVKLFLLCKRRWYMETFEGLKQPPTAAMQFGTDLHGELETYLKTGQEPPSKLARVGIPFLPKPGPHLLVESWMENPTLKVAGVKWSGKIDCCWFDLPEDVLWILDHKTTSDFKWAKTAEELPIDVQMVSYAIWALCRHMEMYPDKLIPYISGKNPKLPNIGLRHVYYLTRGSARAKAVDAFLPVDTIPHIWDELHKTVEQMKLVAQEKSSQPVEKCFGSCNAFGGCPHKERCNITPERMLTMSILADRLKAATEAKKAAAAPAAAPAAPAKAAPVPASKTTVTKNKDGSTTHSTTTESGRVIKLTEGVKPPDAPVKEQAEVEAPAAPATTEAPKRRPGRPPGSKNKAAAAAAEPEAALDAAIAAKVAEKVAKSETVSEPVVESESADALDLFIDCYPTKGLNFGVVRNLNDIVEEVAAAMAVEEKVADLRLIDYMKWKGLLAAYFRQNVPMGAIYANSKDALTEPVIAVLAAKARSVFRAMH